MNEIEYITVARAALLVNRSPRWIQKLIQRGEISTIKVTPRMFLVDPNQVRAVIATSAERGRGRQIGSKNKVKLSAS